MEDKLLITLPLAVVREDLGVVEPFVDLGPGKPCSLRRLNPQPPADRQLDIFENLFQHFFVFVRHQLAPLATDFEHRVWFSPFYSVYLAVFTLPLKAGFEVQLRLRCGRDREVGIARCRILKQMLLSVENLIKWDHFHLRWRSER